MDDLSVSQCNCSMLPVNLSKWTVVKSDGFNALIWKTNSEINNDFYTIERSINGHDWEMIHQESGAGNSSNLNSYHYNDYRFINGVINYYRLTQTDMDGQESVLEIRQVNNRVVYKEIVSVVNILGQTVSLDYEGLSIVTFSDGSVVKKVGK